MQDKPRRTLYHFGHYGYLFKYLVHRIVNGYDEEAVFLFERGGTSDSSVRFVENNEFIKSIGPVIVYFDSRFVGYQSKEELIEATQEFFDGELAKLSLTLDDFDTIHSSYDNHNAFDFYAFSKNRKVTLWDMTGKVTGSPRHSPDPRCKPAYLELQKDVTFRNPLVEKVMFSTPEHTETPKGEVFDLRENLMKLDDSKKDLILNIYNIPSKDEFAGKEFTMLLLCSRSYFSTRNSFEFLQMYRNLVDMANCGKDNLVIKPHPRYDFEPDLIKALFDGSVCLPGYVPSELVPIIPMDVKKVIKTSIVSDVGTDPKIIELGNGETMYHRYFLVALALRHIARTFKARIKFELSAELNEFFKNFIYGFLKTAKYKDAPTFVVCSKGKLTGMLNRDYDTIIELSPETDIKPLMGTEHVQWLNVIELSTDELMPYKSRMAVFSKERFDDFEKYSGKIRMTCSKCTLSIKTTHSREKVRNILADESASEAAYTILLSKISEGISKEEVPGFMTVWDMAQNNPGRTDLLLGKMLNSGLEGNLEFAFEICTRDTNPITNAYLGKMYHRGICIEKDLAKAEDMLEASLKKGPKWVPMELYLTMKESGIGDKIEKAKELLRMAESTGSKEASEELELLG